MPTPAPAPTSGRSPSSSSSAASLAADISEQHAADTMYALAADVSPYLRLTRDCGWTDTRYADLIARTLQATLGAR